MRETHLQEDTKEIAEHLKRGQSLLHVTVRDKKFVLDRESLEKYPESKLSRLLLLGTGHHTLSDGSIYLNFNPGILRYLIDWLNDEEVPTFSENEVGIKEAVSKLANKLGFYSLSQALSVIPEKQTKSEVVKISQEKLITTVNFQTGFHGGTVSYFFWCCINLLLLMLFKTHCSFLFKFNRASFFQNVT